MLYKLVPYISLVESVGHVQDSVGVHPCALVVSVPNDAWRVEPQGLRKLQRKKIHVTR